MNSQVLVSFLRWVAIGVLVAAGSAIAGILSGEPPLRAVLKGVGLALPIWLGALGWGGFDSHRASLVKAQVVFGQPITAIRPYDVAYQILDEHEKLADDYNRVAMENVKLRKWV